MGRYTLGAEAFLAGVFGSLGFSGAMVICSARGSNSREAFSGRIETWGVGDLVVGDVERLRRVDVMSKTAMRYAVAGDLSNLLWFGRNFLNRSIASESRVWNPSSPAPHSIVARYVSSE